MTNKVTVPRAMGIKCPFTGLDLEVFITVGNGSILYSCPEAFSLSEPVASIEELQDRASMRNGVCGAADGVKNPKCPYTGAALRLRTYPDGRFSYAGGFNPRRAFADLDELLYHVTMRDGKAKLPKPEPKPTVVKSHDEPGKREDARVQPSDATLEAMEDLSARHMQRGTSVSTSCPGSRKGSKKKASKKKARGK